MLGRGLSADVEQGLRRLSRCSVLIMPDAHAASCRRRRWSSWRWVWMRRMRALMWGC